MRGLPNVGRRAESIVKAEEMATIKNSFDLQKEYAKKVAQNLYNFLLSFEKVRWRFLGDLPLREPCMTKEARKST